MNFVERTLSLHDSSIHTFSLTCEVPPDGSSTRINSWISAALRRKVQKMILNLQFDYLHGSFMLPRHLFASESLKELELDSLCDLRLPSFVYLPNLKILSLSGVYFMDDNSVQQLFSGCPNLEKLDLIECVWDKVIAVHISAPMLEHLTITELIANEGTEPHRQFMISGPRLKYFCYSGELMNEYCIFDAPSLVDAHLDLYLGGSDLNKNRTQRQTAYRGHKLLRALANVKDLHVSPHALHVLTEAEELVACLPLFHNLKYLEVRRGPMDFGCRALWKILHNSPNLQSIYFKTRMHWSTLSEGDNWQFDAVPPCFLTHLKTIKAEWFKGYEEEVQVLKTILKTSGVLLEIIDTGSVKEKKKFHNVILALPKNA